MIRFRAYEGVARPEHRYLVARDTAGTTVRQIGATWLQSSQGRAETVHEERAGVSHAAGKLWYLLHHGVSV